MTENANIKTVRFTQQENFEQTTSELIRSGYCMISAGFNENKTWCAVLVKEEWK